MKNIFLIAVILSLSGCGQIDRTWVQITGSASAVCVDGVRYLQFTSGASVQLDRSGKPVACN